MALLEDRLVWLERNFLLPDGHIDDMAPCLNSIAGGIQPDLVFDPVQSNTTSAPRPPLSSLTFATTSSGFGFKTP